jgi:Domain of unknown function (DUF4173)
MQQSTTKTLAVCFGSLLFNLIFWNEKQGLNMLIFDVFIVGALYYFHAEAFKTRAVQLVAGGTLAAALLIVIHNSLVVKFIHFLSFSVFVGLVHQTELRFLGTAGLVYMSNWLAVPKNLFKSVQNLPILRGREQAVRGLNGSLLTLLIVPVFFLVYYIANHKFAALSNTAFTHLWNWFSFDIDLSRFLFFLLGVMLVGGAIYKRDVLLQPIFENGFSDNLTNTIELENTEEKSEEDVEKHAAQLQNSYKNALNLTIALNVLLLINNFLDIQNVWFGDNTLLSATELKQFVHEGTYVLIFGIALAIGVTLVLFRGVLNFVKKADIQRGLAYVWLAQNAVLAVSVGMRNWRYIDAYGLAYKRVGVFIFLLLVLFGLYFIYLKIKEKRTFFFFLTRSAWAIYGVLLATCCVNWDVFITKYNLTTATKSGTIDARFVLQDMSNKNLATLLTYRSEILKKMPNQPFSEYDARDYSRPHFINESDKIAFVDRMIARKRDNFQFEQERLTWLSWNFADAQNKAYLK